MAGEARPLLFDAHQHLNDPRFDADRDETALAMEEARIAGLVTGYDLPSSRTAVRTARRHRLLYAAVGIHPQAAGGADDEALRALRALLTDSREAVALGECGLDGALDTPAALQEEAFLRQLRLASELRVPLVLHVRKAHGRMLELLRAHRDGLPPLVLHGCSASFESVREYLSLGAFISFGGVITRPDARRAHQALQAVPQDRLLLETDSPWLPPEPLRGTRNTPLNLPLVCAAAARLRGQPAGETARAALRNAARVFGLEGPEWTE